MKTKRFQFVFKSVISWWIKTVLLVSLLLYLVPSFSQAQSGEDNSWKFVAAPYLVFPYMNGDIAVKGIPLEVDVNPDNIFSNLDFGAMFYFEAANPNWAITFDGLYMNLGKEGHTPLLEREVEAKVDQLALTVAGMYRLNSWIELGLGGRLNSIGSELKIEPGEIVFPGRDLTMTQTWFDPLLVARFMTRFNDNKWRLGALTDIGGFGIGSDFEWQLYPFAGYRISKLIEIDVAYRWLGMDYKTGSGTDRFRYNMVISGPEIGVLFHF